MADKITADYRPDGWLRNSGRQPGIERCGSVLARLNAGLPPCEAVAGWKVTRKIRYGIYTGWYCWDDLPDEYLDAVDAWLDEAEAP